VDHHLPQLFKLMVSLNSQPPVRLETALIFTWQSEFDLCHFTYQELVFELAMMLYTKAILQHKEANRLYRDNLTLNCGQAGQLYLSAAGILQYLGEVLLPKWITQTGPVRPPAVSANFCLFLANYFELVAQSSAIVKMMSKPVAEGASRPFGLLGKLCQALVDRAIVALDQLSADRDISARMHKDRADIIEMVCYYREVGTALAVYYLGESYRIKNETGIALTYLHKAKNMFRDQNPPGGSRRNQPTPYDPSHPGIPHNLFTVEIGGILKNIDESIRQADRDNRMVYFQIIPPEAELPPMPAGVQAMSKTRFDVSHWESSGDIIMLSPPDGVIN